MTIESKIGEARDDLIIVRQTHAARLYYLCLLPLCANDAQSMTIEWGFGRRSPEFQRQFTIYR
jgi:hypothetical protein